MSVNPNRKKIVILILLVVFFTIGITYLSSIVGSQGQDVYIIKHNTFTGEETYVASKIIEENSSCIKFIGLGNVEQKICGTFSVTHFKPNAQPNGNSH